MIFPLLLAVFHVSAVLRILQTPSDTTARIALPLPLDGLASSVWAFFAILVSVRLLRGRSDGRTILVLFTGFILYSIGRLAVFAQADYDRQRLPFLILAAAVIGLITLLFSLLIKPMHLKSINGDNS